MSTEHNINDIKNGLEQLVSLLDSVANKEPAPINIKDKSISGNAIIGGTITKFSSVGIKDDSTRLVVLVNNDGLLTDFIDVETLVGSVNVEEDLNVGGKITAKSLHVDEITADVRNERTSPLEFIAKEQDGNYGQGLVWQGSGPTKKLVYLPNPDRLWTSESIDIQKDKQYSIDKIPVLSINELGSTVTKSNLTSVGRLQGLTVDGDITVDEFLFWNSTSMRLGIGTEAPNGMLSLVSMDAEFVIDPEGDSVKIGTWTTDDLTIVTDDIPRITVSATGNISFGAKGSSDAKVNIYGKLAVGVNNIDSDVSIVTAGPVKFEGKKFEVSDSAPTEGFYKVGDIVWNDNPKPSGYVGWVCTREGTPGIWKQFGQIAS